jgi:hypothetical protein
MHRTRSNSNLSDLKPDEDLLKKVGKKSTMAANAAKTWAYPNTRRDESVVDEHGVADPYRWCVHHQVQIATLRYVHVADSTFID